MVHEKLKVKNPRVKNQNLKKVTTKMLKGSMKNEKPRI